MTNQLQEPLTNYPKPVLSKEEEQVDEEMMSLQALRITNISLAFPMVFKAALELGVLDTMAAAGNNTWQRRDAIQEEKDAFSCAHGMRVFEYIGLDEQFAGMFNHAMSESSIMIMKKILEVYKGDSKM
ncbi:unnamed protein product [Arabidopsis lyrata]|nr:unnamed protein product [Arabidopsis lyrata]